MNITKKKQTHRYREQTSVYSGGGNIGVGEWELQTIGYKFKDVMYKTGNIAKIL